MQKRKMKNNKIILVSLLSVGIILVSLSFLSAGFWDIFTGKASSSNANVTLSNTAPVVYFVSTSNAITLNEDSSTPVTLYFYVNDSDGTDDLDNSSAVLSFNQSGETTRTNSSCVVAGVINQWAINYSCTVSFWYWDNSGSWTVNATISDLQGATDSNVSTSISVDLLTALKISPTALNWASVAITDTDTGADDDPILVNNTGNKDVTLGNVQVKGYNLLGVTTPSKIIYAGNFTTNVNDAANGDKLSNNSLITVTNSILSSGNHSLNYLNDTSGQEQLYFYLEAMNQDLTQQTYSTVGAYGPWVVAI